MSFFQELKRRNVIRVAVAYLALAWLLIEVAGTLFPGFGIPDWAFRLVVILLALGFIPVLVFSWAFEITPEGVKREKELTREAGNEHRAARRLDLLTIGLIIVALAFMAADRFWPAQRAAVEPVTAVVSDVVPADSVDSKALEAPGSIAVLPFANRSDNPKDVFFVDGIHDDLLTYISQIGSLKTISRTSVMKYRDSLLSIPEIASELGVATVLEGGVQRAGDQVRINVQLIDARTDDHLWSHIYDRQLTASNVFAIQSEIAESIAQALRATLTSEEQARIRSVPTENLEALEVYFLGKQHLALRRQSDLLKAIDYFEQAVALDPDFALAWVGLADTWLLNRDVPRSEGISNSRAAAERALQLDPLLGEAHAADAKRRHWQGNREDAEAAFKRALQLTPNYAPAYQWYGQMLQSQPGRIEEALAMLRRATELDPQSAIIFNDYAGGLMAARRPDEALEHFQKAVEIEPRFSRGYWGIATIQLLHRGRLDEAMVAGRMAAALEPGRWEPVSDIGGLYLALGDSEEAHNWASRARMLAPENTTPEILCLLHRYANSLAEAASCSEKALEIRPRWPTYLQFIRDDALARDEHRSARSRMKQSYPELFDENLPKMDWLQRTIALDIAHLLMLAGQEEQMERLLDGAMASAIADNRNPPADMAMHRALTHAVRGNEDEALSEFVDSMKQGFRLQAWYFLDHNPLLNGLRDRPEFKAIKAEVEAELAEQLARVREWEASGELAPMP